MSQQGVRDLLDRIESDEAFRDRLVTAGPIEERRRLVLETGYDVGPDDLLVFKKMVGFEELSDEDLNRLAAGGLGTNIGAGIAGAIGGIGLGAGVGVAGVVAIVAIIP